MLIKQREDSDVFNVKLFNNTQKKTLEFGTFVAIDLCRKSLTALFEVSRAITHVTIFLYLRQYWYRLRLNVSVQNSCVGLRRSFVSVVA